jgi:hypothetical protein
MSVHQIAGALVLAVALSVECSAADEGVRLTVSPGVAVPKIDELKAKLEETLRQPSGTKMYTRQGDKWVEVKPPSLPRGLSAVVRSYNEKERAAHIELAFPQYNMPIVQIWRFDGRRWNDAIDPGIFVR